MNGVSGPRPLAGKAFLLAGGGQGIGRAAASRCGALGASVYVADLGAEVTGKGRDESVAQGAVTSLREEGVTADGACYDLSLAADAKSAVRAARDTYGRLDGAVFTAGMCSQKSLLRFETGDLDRALGLGIRGMFLFVQAVAQVAVEDRRSCSIVLMSDDRVWFGAGDQGANSLVAGAVAAFARCAALEFRRYGVRVNVVAPTARTRQNATLPIFQRAGDASLHPDHVARVVAFLLSEHADGLSGEFLSVAGSHLGTVTPQQQAAVEIESGGDDLEAVASAFARLHGRV